MALQWIGYFEACILLATKRRAGSPKFKWRTILEGVKIRFRLPSISRAASSRTTERFHGRKTSNKRQPVPAILEIDIRELLAGVFYDKADLQFLDDQGGAKRRSVIET
jgi:hypothetical protein